MLWYVVNNYSYINWVNVWNEIPRHHKWLYWNNWANDGVVTLDFVVAPVGHNAINIWFQEWELYKNEGNTSKEAERETSQIVEDAWKLFKTPLIEARLEFITQVTKGTAE